MTSFTELPLSASLQKRLAASQFHTPTPIQSAAIPHALAGKDLMATAQTGTGKTLAFLVPIIERLLQSPTSRSVQALVLVPTRELAMQVHEQFEQLRGKSIPPAALVIGGVSEGRQLDAIRRGARVLVATPGRLEDFLGRRLVDLRNIQVLVLDEADRMLDMGFLPAIRRIVGALPKQRQTMCFSATLEASVAGLVSDYTRNPVRVALGSTLKPVDSVELHAFEVSSADKFDALRHLLRSEKGRTLVFARTKRGTERLANHLVRDGFMAAMIHGDRSQSQRNGALNGFEEGRFNVLVATDVASRGLDIQDVAHVINYDLPTLPEDFIHRVGRTGRAGATGRASTLVCPAETMDLRNIERVLKLRIQRGDINSDISAERSSRPRNTLPTRTLQALPGEVFA
ncbi:MAG TPA: DEAD/DEAH box helicase [Terriglobales bacterium]|nr:DEAD/DEAH box helicase [Terriglobales bacterium]